MSDETEEKRGEKRKREGEKEVNKREVLKEDVTALFRWRLLKSLLKGEIRELRWSFLEGPLGEDWGLV